MIKLNFEIEVSDYDKNTGKESKFETYNVKEEFFEDMKLGDVFKYIYYKYRILKEEELNYVVDNIDLIFFNQFFDEEICSQITSNYKDYENAILRDLESQFIISRLILKLYINPCGLGAGIGEKEGIKFYFHTDEKIHRNTPHIHCKYQGKEFRINLNTLQLMDNTNRIKNKKKINIALEIVSKYKNSLLNYYELIVVRGESVKLKLEF